MKDFKKATVNIISFLELIFKPFIPEEELYIEIRPLPSAEVKKKLADIRHKGIRMNGLRYLFPLTREGMEEAVSFVLEANANGYHAYFGVLPRTGDGEVYASEIFVLFQDVDFHDGDSKDVIELKNRIKAVHEKYGITPSAVIDTGGGYHAYYLLEDPVDRETWKAVQEVLRKTLKADEKVAKDLKRILRLPNTVNWKYDVEAEIVALSEERIPKEQIEPVAERYKIGDTQEVILDRELKKEEIERILQALKPFYVKGYRHEIVNYLTAYLYKNGITEESACTLIEEIAEKFGDEEKEKRVSFVSWLYAKGKDPDSVKGYSGLEEVFETVKEEYNLSADPLEALSVIQEVVGRKTVGKDSLIVYTKFHKTPAGYINSKRRRGIYAFVKEDKIKLTKEILRACIDNVRIIRNPYTNATVFVITFKTKTGRQLEVQGSYREILSRLESEALIVNKGADISLSALLSVAEETGTAEVIDDLDVQGFYLNKEGELVANWEFPERDTEKVIEALATLDELITKWFDLDAKAVATIKWGMLAPFFFVRKQMELSPWKWLFLLGTGGTGKSTLLQLIAYIFKVPLALMEISAGSLSTEARLGRKLSQWTFPFIVNEAKGIFTGNEEIRELIKNAWDRLTVRGKYKDGQFIEELSLAPLSFTSNEHIEFTQAELRRLDVLLFSWKDRVDEEKRLEFENWKKKLKTLEALGREIFEIVKEDQEEVLGAETYLQAGEVLLERLYKKFSLEVPEWVHISPSQEDFFGTEKDYQEQLRDGIVTLLKTYVVQKLKEYTGHTTVYIPELPDEQRYRNELRWRLIYLQRKNIPLDVCLFEGDQTDEIIIKKGFLDYLKKNGLRVGTLKEVAELLGGVYGMATFRSLGIEGLKIVRVPYEVFEEEPEPILKEDESEELPF